MPHKNRPNNSRDKELVAFPCHLQCSRRRFRHDFNGRATRAICLPETHTPNRTASLHTSPRLANRNRTCLVAPFHEASAWHSQKRGRDSNPPFVRCDTVAVGAPYLTLSDFLRHPLDRPSCSHRVADVPAFFANMIKVENSDVAVPAIHARVRFLPVSHELPNRSPRRLLVNPRSRFVIVLVANVVLSDCFSTFRYICVRHRCPMAAANCSTPLSFRRLYHTCLTGRKGKMYAGAFGTPPTGGNHL